MKIEEGKYYRTRDGQIVGPMQRRDHQSPYNWADLNHCWTDNGRFSLSPRENNYDLISEVYVSDTPPSDALKTEAELRQMMRDPRYWQKRDPEWIKRVTDGFRALVGGDTPSAPEVETLRDRFAGRVLTGMMADHTAPNRPPEFFADLAYKYADAMMEVRKK
jgi:hypothetical protein